MIVSPLYIPKITSFKKSFNFSSRCFRYTTIFWGHCPTDGHLHHFQNFRNKNKDAKKTIELRPLGLVCIFLWDRYYKRDGWGEALLWQALLNWPWKTRGPSAQRKWRLDETEPWISDVFLSLTLPCSQYFHPAPTSTLAGGFFCPLPLSALAYLQGALPCLWSIKSQGCLAYARSG